MRRPNGLLVGAAFAVGCVVGASFGPRLVPFASAGPGGPPPHQELLVPKATQSQAAKLSRWEYRCVSGYSASDFEEKANKLGAENWDLAAATANVICFKRAKL